MIHMITAIAHIKFTDMFMHTLCIHAFSIAVEFKSVPVTQLNQ